MPNSPYIFFRNISTNLDMLIPNSALGLNRVGGMGITLSHTQPCETLLSHDTIVSHRIQPHSTKQAQNPTYCNHNKKASFCTARRLHQNAIPQLSGAILRNTSMGFAGHNIFKGHDVTTDIIGAVASCLFDNQFTSDNIETVNFLYN